MPGLRGAQIRFSSLCSASHPHRCSWCPEACGSFQVFSCCLLTKGNHDPSAFALSVALTVFSLAVTAHSPIVGILSERDIVRAIAERGALALGEPVSVVMTRSVSTCNETETVISVMERMSAGKFRHMPVVDQGRPVGMVSISDVVKHRLHTMERDSAAMREYIMTA
jgi:hypothetical protein